jgi:hypothetical protein
MSKAKGKWWRKPVVVVPLGMVVLGVIGVVGFRMAAARVGAGDGGDSSAGVADES